MEKYIEPWYVEENPSGYYCLHTTILDAYGNTVCTAVDLDYALRIISCCNACAGIKTEDLGKPVVSESELAAIALLRDYVDDSEKFGFGYDWESRVHEFLATYDASGAIIIETPECTGDVKP